MSGEDPGQSSPLDNDLTELLELARLGDGAARDAVYARSFAALRSYAHRLMRGRDSTVMPPTALIGEAWARVDGGRTRDVPWADRHHFLRTLARAMRHVVIDHERQRRSCTREAPGRRVEFDDPDLEALHNDYRARAEDLVALDEALERLQESRPRLVQIVECRFFLGLSQRETARELGLSERSVTRHFAEARDWLYRAMTGQERGLELPDEVDDAVDVRVGGGV